MKKEDGCWYRPITNVKDPTQTGGLHEQTINIIEAS